MHDTACSLPRILLPRTSVNKDCRARPHPDAVVGDEGVTVGSSASQPRRGEPRDHYEIKNPLTGGVLSYNSPEPTENYLQRASQKEG